MSTYAIGDIQGCDATFAALLDLIEFNREKDELWLVGDLVNRGPSSLEVLRRVRSLGDSIVTVLGNHDLHLLARAAGVAPRKPLDTLDAVLDAPDRDDLISWLSRQPLLYRRDGFVLVHAGVLPEWTVEFSEELAMRVSETLKGPERQELLQLLSSKEGAQRPGTGRMGVLAEAARVLSRIRTCTLRGELCLSFSGHPREAPFPCLPWFEIPGRRSHEATIVFGHWSAMGRVIRPGIVALDSGCVWGGSLSAVRMEDSQWFEVPCLDRVRRARLQSRERSQGAASAGQIAWGQKSTGGRSGRGSAPRLRT